VFPEISTYFHLSTVVVFLGHRGSRGQSDVSLHFLVRCTTLDCGFAAVVNGTGYRRANFSLSQPGRLVVRPSTPAAARREAFAGASTVQI